MTAWNDATKYFRVAAMAIFIYDWMLTLPAEIRLYRKNSGHRPSVACILLVLARYLGLLALLTNFIGFFAHFFPDEPNPACRHFYRIMPVTQCLASWASHAIFVVRTTAICNKARSAKIGFTAAAVFVAGLELFSQIYSFFKYKVGSTNNCLVQYEASRNYAWLYYAASTLFDLIIVVATYRGLAISHSSALKSGLSSGTFNDILWNSSIVFFGVTTVFNIFNLAFYTVYDNSNATILCAMGIAVTSMMSVRVILDMHSYADKRYSSMRLNALNYSDFPSERACQPQSSFWGLPSRTTSIYSSMPVTPSTNQGHGPQPFNPLSEKAVDSLTYPSRPMSVPTRGTGVTVMRTVEVYSEERPESWESRWGQPTGRIGVPIRSSL